MQSVIDTLDGQAPSSDDGAMRWCPPERRGEIVRALVREFRRSRIAPVRRAYRRRRGGRW